MKLYQLRRIQKLPISLEEAWAFFSSPANLKKITPPFMGFDIISGAGQTMFQGQIIQYTVKPVLGIPVSWVTEISHVVENKYFVDNQLFGPYALWHHKHFFKEIPGGIEMEDIVDYKLPFGIFGRIAHQLLVKQKLNEIFNYREKILKERFGSL
jgi:ligand-binding SRPBCC domain-containing protein